MTKNIYLRIVIIGDDMNNLIGNTPMIQIFYKYKTKLKFVFAKLEYYNITGSIKDRMALYILKKEKENNTLKDNDPIIEATSGNTGISFAALGSKYNHPVHIFMPNWVSEEREKLINMYGAKIYLFSKNEGGFKRCIEEADKLSKQINGYRPNQFSNKYNIEAHYETTGKEIFNQLKKVDGFISGVGTGGTLMGVGKYLKEKNSEFKLYALEPTQLPVITKGINLGNHKIEGIGDEFIPELLDTNKIDKILLIDDNDAINMSRLLASKLGLGVGISSGANFLGSVLMNEEIAGNVATVFPDDNKKYLTTELSNKISEDKTLISNNIELISYRNV